MTDSELADEVLVQRIHAGDQRAFAILFERYADLLRKHILRRMSPALRRKVSVSDVLQEGRIVAFRRFQEFQYRDDNAVPKWLGRIVELKVKEAVKQYRRTAKRAAVREVSRDERRDTAQFPGRQASPSQAAANAELKELARGALARLSEDHREILRLTREEGMNFPEAGRRMGRSADAARKLYGRAAAQFAQVFERLKGGRDA